MLADGEVGAGPRGAGAGDGVATFPAASLARTKYDTVALAGRVSVYVVTLPATDVSRALFA